MKTTFWNYLKNNHIEIPIIQRDYAQGRLGKENLRKIFLGDIKKALDNAFPYKDTEMKLDFVYGSKERDIINPLDGQQRLTTLWLLHWYIALRSGVLNEDNCNVFKHFTYETRISSREFCQNLCVPEHFETFNGTNIVEFITKQTWFYSVWKQDPTIQSMLRMLGGTKISNKNDEDTIDGIEELFKCPQECKIFEGPKCVAYRRFNKYWNELTGDNCPIVFYHLPLEDFGLSDDLYIKMNARGKQLTSFENFKADLIGYITKQAEETIDTNNKWYNLLDSINGIPIKLDTDWTDLFWENRSQGIIDKDGKKHRLNQIDEIFFAFLNRFFWNELFIAHKNDNPTEYILDIGKGDESYAQENENNTYRYLNDSNNRNPNDYDTKIAYEDFDVYKYDKGIPVAFFYKLRTVLNNYFCYSKKNKLPKCSWDADFQFIPQYILDDNSNNIEITNNANDRILKVSTLTQVQRIVFFSVCKYFEEGDGEYESLRKWLRVVWNLVSGQGEDGRPQIRSTMAVRTAIEHIYRLDSHNVYNSLDKMTRDEGSTDFSSRWNEEIDKAKQILNGKPRNDGEAWESIIIKAENYAFFKGSIRFLFQDEDGKVDWQLFDTKFECVKHYFLENTPNKASAMQEPYRNANLLKMMISWFGSETFENVIMWKHRTFNNKPETWLYYLINRHNCRPVHHLLLGEKNNIISSQQSAEFAERAIFLLSNTTLLDFVRVKIPNSWIRDYHYHKAIFPSGPGVFLNAEKRDNLLANTPGVMVREKHIIPGTTLLYGSDIDFIYRGKNFRWHRKDYVYLTEDFSYQTNMFRDMDAKQETDKYYCFNAQEINDAESLIQELDSLIEASISSNTTNLVEQ
jgi:hypothetical protein